MIPRVLGDKLRSLAEVFPVVSVTGPRQSGKTTLVRALFPHYAYVNLENLDDRLAAGRVAISHLMPFSVPELERARRLPDNLDDFLFTGTYPVLYDRKVSPTDYFPSYIQTYVERDVRSITNVGDLSMFQRFVKLCAGRVGQWLNLSGIGTELGINYKTVRSWISILEASFHRLSVDPSPSQFQQACGEAAKAVFLRYRPTLCPARHSIRGAVKYPLSPGTDL